MSYFLFSLLLGAVATGLICLNTVNVKKNLPWIAAIGGAMFIVFWIINYKLLPVLNPLGFDFFWIEITLAVLLGCLGFDKHDEIGLTVGLRSTSGICVLSCALMLLVRILISTPVLHASSFSKLIQPEIVEDSSFNQIHPIPVEKMINVKQEYAEDLASKRIENMPSLGSRCTFGKADMINLNGSFNVKTAEGEKMTLTFNNEKVWVLPLEHRGFWKWFHQEITQGYCIVSAHDPSRIFFVTELEGKPLALKYLRSAWFGDEIERHVRTNGYASYGLTEYSMELDDNGYPYWVITVFKPTIGFEGEDATGVLVVDMQTGDIKEYSIDKAPEWVDRIQPDEFLIEQINDWGKYQKGWWNAIFAEDGVRECTPGMSLVYSEGKSYWYTGIQSKGADKSTSGFMLIDTRTKECKLYPVSGINEEAAKNVIEAQSEWVRMSKFKANNPVLYNVHGIPTYYMTLTGDGIKNAGYAFVSLKSELVFAAAATPQKALTDYLKVAQRGSQFNITDGDIVKEELQQMTLRAITFENGIYYLLFNEVKGKEFTASSDAFPEVKWAQKGQKVNISYTDTEATVISLNSFDIIDFEI